MTIKLLNSWQPEDQLTSFQQITKQLHLTNEKTESINQVFLKTVTEQNVELEQLRKQQRQSKLGLRTTIAKADEMMRLVEELRSQLNRKEEEVLAAREKEEASDKRLQELQSSIKQLETRQSKLDLRTTVAKAGGMMRLIEGSGLSKVFLFLDI
uniref:Uncharacterized protein n=1 Tax=Micrurus lemniscatus lemniscatus TaxID=129467 RepID=A0A2D4IL27_MICLE